MHGDFVAKAVLIIADPRQRAMSWSVGASFFVFWPPPASVNAVYDGRNDKRPWAVAVIFDAMFENCLLYTSPSPRDRG